MIWLILTCAIAGTPSHAAMDKANWATVTTKSNSDAGEIGIWRTTVDGVECFRGTAITDVPGSKMLAVVQDVAGAVKWSSAGVSEAKLLSSSGGRIEYYQYLDVPGWTMASDRFWFLHSTVEETTDRISFRWNRLEGGGQHADVFASVKQAHPSAVEPPINVGSWTFASEDDGTHITYQVCTDAGGSIPAAVQNAATKKTLPDALGDVVREARKR